MDREKVTKPTAQIGFIKFVLTPMFESVAKVNCNLWPAFTARHNAARCIVIIIIFYYATEAAQTQYNHTQ